MEINCIFMKTSKNNKRQRKVKLMVMVMVKDLDKYIDNDKTKT